MAVGVPNGGFLAHQKAPMSSLAEVADAHVHRAGARRGSAVLRTGCADTAVEVRIEGTGRACLASGKKCVLQRGPLHAIELDQG